MTIAISSFQRRRELERLLRSLAGELEGRPELAVGLDVVVVLDGSTDGSLEMIEHLPYPVPLRAHWQPNAGLAAARNAGLANASGELVWLLDDDLLVATGTLARHRRVDAPDDRRLVVGPCHLLDGERVHPEVRRFWGDRYAALARDGVVARFDQFSAANTSGPVSVFSAHGGFDAGFVGYGAEDYELAVRLLDAGVPIAYDPRAVMWHAPAHGVVAMCTRAPSEARNQIRLATLHPRVFDDVFPQSLTPPMRWIRDAGLHRHPRVLRAIGRVLTPLAVVEAMVTQQRSSWVLGSASVALYLAEVAVHDPSGRVMTKVLGLDDVSA